MFAFYHDYSLIQSLTRTDELRTPSSRVISMHLLDVLCIPFFFLPCIPPHLIILPLCLLEKLMVNLW